MYKRITSRKNSDVLLIGSHRNKGIREQEKNDQQTARRKRHVRNHSKDVLGIAELQEIASNGL